MDLQETIERLKLHIYPPGYIEHQSDYSDIQSSNQQQDAKEKNLESKQVNQAQVSKGQRIQNTFSFPRQVFTTQKKSNIKVPFISNLNNPNQDIKSENWTTAEDKQLLNIVFTKNLTPNYAALYLKGRTPAACSRRFSRLKQEYSEDQWAKLTRKPKSLFKKNPKHWDLKQDQKLMEGIRQYGTKWSIISKQIFNGQRTPGAISDRFRVLRRRCGYIENGHGDNQDVELVNENMIL